MKKFSWIFVSLFLIGTAYSQNNTGIGTNSPNSKALLELQNNGNPLGLLLPRQDISTFTLGLTDAGMMVYNTVDNKVYTWDGSTWVSGTSEWGVSGSNIFNLNTGNVGIGTSTPFSTLSVDGSITVDHADANIGDFTTGLKFGSGNTGEVIASNRSAGVNQFGIDFYTGYANRMAITSGGNVGIGNTAPMARLTVTSTSNLAFQVNSASNVGTWFSMNNTSAGGEWFHIINTGASNVEGAGKLLFHKGSGAGGVSGLFMTMDHASNNIGIGTDNPTEKLTITNNVFGGILSLNSSALNTLMDFNNTSANPANWTFGYLGNTGVNPGYMTFLRGSHRFVVTNNGDIGIAETNPQARLEINSSGNSAASYALLINNSSPSSIFALQDDGNLGLGVPSPAGALEIDNAEWNSNPVILNTSGTVGPTIRFQNTVVGNNTYDIIGSTGTGATTGPGFFGIYDNTFPTGYRLVISPTGLVGVGTTAPAANLHVIGTGIFTDRFELTGTTDANGISGSGVLEIGGSLRIDPNEIITNSNSPLSLQADNNGDLFVDAGTFMVDASTDRVGIGTNSPATSLHVNHPTGISNGLSISNDGDADRWHFYCWSSNTLRLYYNGAERGTFNPTTGAYSSVSDRRFKNDIKPMPSVLDKVAQLQPVEYNFNWQKDPNQKHTGFIAQDVEPLFPGLVTQTKSDHPSENTKEINDSYSLDYSGFSVIAIKAIQELKAQNEALLKRIEALESK